MIIQKMVHAVKIIFKYSTKLSLRWDRVGSVQRDKIFLKVFLRDGSVIDNDEIKDLSISLKEGAD